MQFAASDRASRINDAVLRHHCNASVQLTPGGQSVQALYECLSLDTGIMADRSPFADMATVPAHRLSLCVVSLGDLAEGDALVVTTAHWPAGQACRITTPVAPDAGGWARFDVVPE